MNEHDDDPLVRALRAPGTSAELGGERDAVAAYRATFGAPRRSRRALGRLGLGGGAFVLSIALGGGVAAAYTRTLPDPVQDFAHSVLGPVGVPAAEPRGRRPRPEVAAPAGPDTATAPADPTSTATDVPAQSGTTTPPTSPPTGNTSPRTGEATESAAPGGGPSPVPPSGQPSPTAPPTSDPTAPPTTPPTTDPEPPPTPPQPWPRAVSIAVSDTKVDPGEVVAVSGTVTDAKGASVADRAVRLAYRTAGGEWVVVASGRTASDGTVSFTSPPVTENVATRLVVRQKVISTKVRIEVKPSVVASAGTGVVDVEARGGQAGDTVVLVKVVDGRTEEVGRQALSSGATASFDVDPATRRVVYVARLLRTPRHLPADDRVAVPRA